MSGTLLHHYNTIYVPIVELGNSQLEVLLKPQGVELLYYVGQRNTFGRPG
jgi:hypothetical protein